MLMYRPFMIIFLSHPVLYNLCNWSSIPK